MLGQVSSLKVGNQKLVSVDSIALFGIVGLLAAIGAIMSHNFQSDESAYLDSFRPTNIPVAASGIVFNDTCLDAQVECVPSYTISVTVNCSLPSPHPVCGVVTPESEPITRDFDYGNNFDAWNATLYDFLLPVVDGAKTTVPGFISSDNNRDFRFFATAVCTKWCDGTTWMYRLCVAVAGLCVGFSGLVFLYLYLGCIFERLYPRRRLERLKNLLLMRGEEAPKLDRVNTASKSESIRPDLKEY